MPVHVFPSNFQWGVATASYQIEGAVSEGGRGPSVWDTFCATPGKVAGGESGAVACDHYHRYPEDVALLASLGVPNYRFSIAWSRIFPDGTGTPNPAGLDFYSRLLDALHEKGIAPAITLFHWDYPEALHQQGGWTHPDAHLWFGDYAETVFEAFGDRCKRWITINEPWCYAHLGHGDGIHAPGVKSETEPYLVGHGLLVGHGEAVARYRGLGQDGEIGITTNHWWAVPHSESEEDKLATSQFNDWNVGWFLDPIYKGDYPEFMRERYVMPEFTDETRDLVMQPTDFMGINFYQAEAVRWSDTARNNAETVPIRKDHTTEMGWQRVPETLTDSLVLSQQVYDPPRIYITENGCAYPDVVEGDRVHDPLRVQFISDYIAAAHSAIQLGAKVEGYFAWSFMDNFEWAEGYRPRFGLVYVDYETQRRIPKDSVLEFSKIIHANGLIDARE